MTYTWALNELELDVVYNRFLTNLFELIELETRYGCFSCDGSSREDFIQHLCAIGVL